jgi:anti-anti-sigma factor
LTVIFDLTYGVIGGAVLTVLLNLKNIRIGLQIEKEQDGEIPTIKLYGALFFLTAPKLADILSETFQNSDKVIVDMSGINRIDETSLEKIVALNKRIKQQGKDLELVSYYAPVLQQFLYLAVVICDHFVNIKVVICRPEAFALVENALP